MPRIPVRLGQENRVKVITAFGAPDIPILAINATNVAGGIVTSTRLIIDGKSDFLGISTFQDDVYLYKNLHVLGISTFVGSVTFEGGTIGIGNSTTDNVIFTGEIDSDFVPNIDDTYNLGSQIQQWKNIYASNIKVTGITTIQAGVGKTYGIPYFGSNAEVLSTNTPSVGIQTTNLLLTVDENNIPVWTDSIDGGFY